ncbi:MAG: ACT domain-containing protein [Planctomycetota bacterium]
MRFRVRPGGYALVSLPVSRAEGYGEFLPGIARSFAQVVSEPGSVTLLLPERRLPKGLRKGRGCRIRRGFRVISFESPLEWTVVGFLARVAGALAEAGVPIGVVCSFDFDHVFVPARRLGRARRAIARALRLP